MYSVHHKLKSDADIDEHFAVLYFPALWAHQWFQSEETIQREWKGMKRWESVVGCMKIWQKMHKIKKTLWEARIDRYGGDGCTSGSNLGNARQ